MRNTSANAQSRRALRGGDSTPRWLRRVARPLLFAIGTFTAATLLAGVPVGGPYVLAKQVIAGGGALSSGGPYVLTATVGQSVGGLTTTGALNLQQGFHTARTAPADELFRNGFE